jgi:hypothetical protein
MKNLKQIFTQIKRGPPDLPCIPSPGGLRMCFVNSFCNGSHALIQNNAVNLLPCESTSYKSNYRLSVLIVYRQANVCFDISTFY